MNDNKQEEVNQGAPNHVRPILVSFLNFIGFVNSGFWFLFLIASYVQKLEIKTHSAAEESFISFVFMCAFGIGVVSSSILFTSAYVVNKISKIAHYSESSSNKLFEIERWIAARERR